MKHDNETKTALRYEAPVADAVLLVTESFTMLSTESSLEDYGDNPIFGSTMESILF